VRLPEQNDPDLAPLAATFNATIDALEHRVKQDARFAGDVSHELRSPLTTMVNAVEVLQHRRETFDSAAGQAVDLLVAEIDHFQLMVVDLLEISRAEQDDDDRALELLDLTELVDKVSGATPGCPRPVVDDEPASVVVADRRRLVRLVANLLDNANRHGGGVVRLAVSTHVDVARIEVDEAGPGVPAELRQQIFERFARVRDHPDDGGSGLGLALVCSPRGSAPRVGVG
jgi:signal transduction histidine kinase